MAERPEQAIDLLSTNPVRVIVSDMMMPGMSGLELLSRVRHGWPKVIRLMLTGEDRAGVASQVINKDEVFRFLTKPIEIDELSEAVRQALSFSYLEEEKERLDKMVNEQNRLLREHNGHLEKTVAERTQELRASYLATVIALSEALEAKDPYTRGHSERVASMAVEIARTMSFTGHQVEEIHLAGVLHDIGKIGVPERILQKQGPLTQEERTTMRLHPGIGVRIVKPVLHPENIIPAIFQHHEWYGGNGYPNGLKGEEISIGARVLCIADTLDAMSSVRPYRKQFPPEIIMAELDRYSGDQFDPEIVKVVRQIYDADVNTLFPKRT